MSTLDDLSALEDDGVAFVRRHVGPGAGEQAEMLSTLGYATLADLAAAAVPPGLRAARPLELPAARDEVAVSERLRELAALNHPLVPMIGLGYHGTVTPAIIRRNVLESPAWYTAYTPYQPEISQGRLEALLNFQTMVADLTGLPIANASLLDEATALAEAMTLVRRAQRSTKSTFVIDSDTLPQTLAVLHTRAAALGIDIRVADVYDDELVLDDAFGVAVAYPGASGAVRDPRPVISRAHDAGAMVIADTDPLALTVLESPGELGADVAVGSSQRFGVPLFYGGPHAAYIAVRTGLERSLPGRLVGVSVDSVGRPAYRLALQTREQHIRRDKATSNICTAQVLLAVAASMYAVYHGPDGLRRIATRVHRYTALLARALRDGGLPPTQDAFFDTLRVDVPGRADQIRAAARALGIHLYAEGDTVGVSVSEIT
ncbi:MAG: glycine dehydrogenase, partial [Sciscionella sp.]